jgi:single stranded DNA-binding protein
MKQITIDGRVGKDAQVMKTQGGKSYLRFSLANDSFVNGANKTEWFDVTSFDNFMVENRTKFLTKGRYVIVNGTLNSEVTSKNGKIYLNQYVTANNIEFPSFGSKKDDSNEVQVSTYTGGTKSDQTVHEEAQPAPVVETPKATPAPQPAPAQVAASGWSNDDDLPF